MCDKKILFIGSHPDDIDFGCASSMHDHYLKRDKITTIVLTQGEKGGDSVVRVLEQKKSFNIVAPDSNNIFLHFPDTMLFIYMNEVISKIRSEIQENIPEIVYIPSRFDYHQDHVVTNECALAVFNNLKCQIICYETPSSTPEFSPSYFKLFSEKKFNVKLDALKCHQSQIDKDYFSEDIILSLAKMRAVQCRYYSYLAEAFEIIRLTEI